ncbi:hypothetical protein BDW75DRAFT_217155 [Aspergillus navahoensis]
MIKQLKVSPSSSHLDLNGNAFPKMTATTHIPYRLDGKVALVTGSGRGIGAAMAVELGRLGAKVAVNYANSHEPAEKIVQGIKKLGTDAIALQANIRNASEIVKVMDDA